MHAMICWAYGLLQSSMQEVQVNDDRPATVTDPQAIAQLPPPDPAAVLLPPVSTSTAHSRDKLLVACHSTLASVGASQRAVADEAAAMTRELDAITRTTLSTTGDGVTALLRAKNLTHMVEIQLTLAQQNLCAIAAGSARLGELGLRLWVGASKPFLDAARQPERAAI
jgi:hypothetical protein